MAEVFLLMLLFLWLQMHPAECISSSLADTIMDLFYLPSKYYQIGDFIIGAITTQFVCVFEELSFSEHPKTSKVDEIAQTPKNYLHILSLEFAVKEINENPNILSNISLGFEIYDSYTSARITHQNVLKLLSTPERIIPNYNCDTRKNLIAVIGGLESEISFHMATILGIYKIPQIACSVLAPAIRVQTQFPAFYRMVPNEMYQYTGIVRLLLHYQWTWVGIIALDNDDGETFVQTLTSMFSQHGICTAFSEKTPGLSQVMETVGSLSKIQAKAAFLTNPQINVIIVNAEPQTTTWLKWFIYLYSMFEGTAYTTFGKVWIMTAQWDFSTETTQKAFNIQAFSGALSFAIQTNEVIGFLGFLQMLHPGSQKGDHFLNIFWEHIFGCSLTNFNEFNVNCTGQEKLERLPGVLFEMSMTGQSYSIYNAVYAIAHALHKIVKHKPTAMMNEYRRLSPIIQPWQGISFNNSAGDFMSFDKNCELAAGFDIINWVTFPNQSFSSVKVGRILRSQELILNKEAISWHMSFHQVQPTALCNENCHPGSRRKKKKGRPFCCFDCVPCTNGKISDRKDMDDCITCPEGQYPNKKQDQCNLKTLSFLSFSEPLGIISTFFSLFFSLITAIVLIIFTKNKNTPFVKANNVDLSYTLLVSLFFCFLCSLLYIGVPHTVTCYLQHAAFMVIFTVAVSCVLAKTITVVVAFMATKPGSRMKNWVRKRLANSILLGCSFIQVIISTLSLLISPSFPDVDMHSLSEEIIVECNEGSVIMFYCGLGYLGFLAFASLIMAFFARKLPASFNEAKLITFGMLMFCSVLLCYLSAYLSIKGKGFVILEIFSMLASSAGLLVFIFFPKCYIIIMRPELNCKGQLVRKIRKTPRLKSCAHLPDSELQK